MDYQFKSIGIAEIKYSLNDINLSIYYEKSKEQINVLLSEIKKVWHMVDKYNYYTYLYTDNKKFKIVSQTVKGLGNVKNQIGEYTAFVKELHSKLVSINSNAKFVYGSTPLVAYEWGAVIVGIAILFLRYIFSLIFAHYQIHSVYLMYFLRFFYRITSLKIIWAPIVPVVILIAGLSALFSGKKKTYTPDKLPAKYLPVSISPASIKEINEELKKL